MNERAERLKKLFENSGMSYHEAAKITGLSKSSLQRYANGVTTKIPLDAIEKLAHLFGVSQSYLMGWDEQPAEELQGMGTLAAQMIMDPGAMEVMQKYMAMSEADRRAVRDYMAMSEVDRYAVQLVMASIAGKQKKTDAGASVVESEKSFEKADCDM